MDSITEEKPRKVDSKIFEIIEKLSRLETLLEAFNKANDKDLVLIKEGLAAALKSLYDQDKRLDQLEKEFIKVKVHYDKMKWIWGAIAFVIAPIITAVIAWILHTILGL